MPAQNNIAAIENIFKSQIVEATRLLDVLREEYNALSENNSERFISLVSDKQASAENMVELEKQLFASLGKLGLSGDKSGIEHFIQKAKQQKFNSLIATWDALQNIAAKCREQNQINGRVINLAKVSTKHALDIIHGQESESSTYNQLGKTDDNDDGQSLAIA